MLSYLRTVAPGIVILLGWLQVVSAIPHTKDEWIKIKSKHFLLIGNAKEKEVHNVASKLEQFRSVFSQLFPNAKFNDSVPTTVIVFKNENAYNLYRPVYQGKTVAFGGYFIPGRDRNYITLMPNSPGLYPYSTIYHELTHLVVSATLKTLPTWANEGLAEYYETIAISEDGKTIELGGANPYHILTLREKKLIPLREFFLINRTSPEYNERNKQTIFYAQSWALTHYFMLGDRGSMRPQFAKLLSLLENNVPTEDALKKIFQTDVNELQKALEKYIRSDSFYVEKLRSSVSLVDESAYERQPISDAEVFACLGDLLSRFPDKQDSAEMHLKKALNLAPDLAAAHASLGLLRMRQGREAEAEASLKRAVAAPTASPLAHYYYARLLLRRGLSSPENIAAVQTSLATALAQMPDFAEGFSVSAHVELVAGNLDKASADIQRAIAILPGRRDFTIIKAHIHCQRQEWTEAKRLLTPLAQLEDDPVSATNAADLLALIATHEKAQQSPSTQQSSVDIRGYLSDVIEPNERQETRAPSIPYLKRKTGMLRIEGVIERFECVNGKAFVHVRAPDGSVKLGIDFTKAELVAHTDDMSDTIGCDSTIPNPVIVMYRAAAQPVAGEVGEVISMEFLPRPK